MIEISGAISIGITVSPFSRHQISHCDFIHPSRFEFTYGVETRYFAGIATVPNLSPYKMMVQNLQNAMKNDNMILLQNEEWFLSYNYLKGTLHH